jgi:cytochrome c nitrite reductase small subunit
MGRGRGRGRALQAATHALVLAAAVGLGLAGGLGVFTANYAGALSYLSADPKACANCHIMQSQYDSWQKASHHTVATCVDCHLPHTFFPKYVAKTENGYRHSRAFTLQDFDEPIRIKGNNIQHLYDNCVRCHGDLAHPLIASGLRRDGSSRQETLTFCVHCHANVGHGEKAGLGGRRRPNE